MKPAVTHAQAQAHAHAHAPRAATAPGAQAASAGGETPVDAFAALLDGLCPAEGAPAPTLADTEPKKAGRTEPAPGEKAATPAPSALPDAFLALLPGQPGGATPAVANEAPRAQAGTKEITAGDPKAKPALPELQADAAPEAAQHPAASAAFQALVAAAPGGSAAQERARSETAPAEHAPDASALAAMTAAPATPRQADPAVPASPVHQAALPSHPLEAAFAGDLGVEVRWMLESGLQQAELHLHPADLGPIHIQLSVQQQAADISFTAAHATTREGLQQALPALREMFAGQGLQLAQAGVSGGQAGQSFAQQQQQRERAAPRQDKGATQAVGAGTGTRRSGAARLQGGLGLLDLYA